MGGGDHFGGADPDATPLDEGEVTNIACCHCLNLCPTSFFPSPFSNSRSLSAKDSYRIISVEVFNFDTIFSFSQPMTFIQNLMSIPTTKGAGEQHHCDCRSNRGMTEIKQGNDQRHYLPLSAISPTIFFFVCLLSTKKSRMINCVLLHRWISRRRPCLSGQSLIWPGQDTVMKISE